MTTWSSFPSRRLACVALFVASYCFAAEEVSVTDAPIASKHYELGISTSVRATQGSFDAYGAYHAFPDGSKAWSTMSNLSGWYRVSRSWEVGMMLPIRHSEMSLPSGSMTSNGVGGAVLETKVHLGGWPHLVLHVGGSLPWQYRTRDQVGDPSASMPDDMGDGSPSGPSLRVGLGGSRMLQRFRIALDVSAFHPFATPRTPDDAPAGAAAMTMQQGNRVQLSEGLGFKLVKSLSINGSLRQLWGDQTIVNGNAIDGTRSRMFSTSLGVSYLPSTDWRWTVSYDTPYPFYSYAVNQSYAPGVSLAMMYVGM